MLSDERCSRTLDFLDTDAVTACCTHVELDYESNCERAHMFSDDLMQSFLRWVATRDGGLNAEQHGRLRASARVILAMIERTEDMNW